MQIHRKKNLKKKLFVLGFLGVCTPDMLCYF